MSARPRLGLLLALLCGGCPASTPPPSAPGTTTTGSTADGPAAAAMPTACPEGTEAREEPLNGDVLHSCVVPGQSVNGLPYRNGPYVLVGADGKIRGTGQWVDNVEEGLWRWWYANGKLRREATYAAGKITADANWDETGRPVDRHDPTGQTTWYPNGNKKDELIVTEQSYERTSWYENGTMTRQEKSADGKHEKAEWFENGQKREQASFDKDGKMVAWQGWSSTGKEITGASCTEDADCVPFVKNECWVCNPPYEPLTRWQAADRQIHPPKPPKCDRKGPVPPCKHIPGAPGAKCQAAKCVLTSVFGD
jgi:hypothetical protein